MGNGENKLIPPKVPAPLCESGHIGDGFGPPGRCVGKLGKFEVA